MVAHANSDTTTTDQSQQNRDHSNDQQDMNQATHRVRSDQSKQPENDKYYRNCFQHNDIP